MMVVINNVKKFEAQKHALSCLYRTVIFRLEKIIYFAGCLQIDLFSAKSMIF